MRQYLVRRAASSAAAGESLRIDQFRPEGSDHRPRAVATVTYDQVGLRVVFVVADRYVRCVHSEPQSAVCMDSCVEFFVRPRPDRGYFNFEANCGGALLAFYITDWRRLGAERKLAGFSPLMAEEIAQIQISASLPGRVEPEIIEPVEWRLEMFIPFKVLAKYVGPLGDLPGQCWRANFYKCGGDTSHPHWAAWNPVSELNFHVPAEFGELKFE